MLARKAGAHVVWAVRRQRPGAASHAGFGGVYYWLLRHVAGLKAMPANGADFFLIDRAVIDAFRQFPERSVSVLALVMWLGFRQEFIEYDKKPRASGKSGWTLARKITLVVDSVTAFSEAPIRAYAAGVALLAGARAAGGGLRRWGDGRHSAAGRPWPEWAACSWSPPDWWANTCGALENAAPAAVRHRSATGQPCRRRAAELS
jgi:hypothetical protein